MTQTKVITVYTITKYKTSSEKIINEIKMTIFPKTLSEQCKTN